MGSPIFRSHCRNCPSPAVEVQLAPLHAANFTPALASEDEQLGNGPKRETKSTGRAPHKPHLMDAKNAVAAFFGRRRLDPFARAALDDSARHGPAAHLPQSGEGAICADRGTAGDDCVENRVDVCLAYFCERTAIPGTGELL